MATLENDFLPFATGSGANVDDQATYADAATTGTGFVSGIAKSASVNKVLRQASTMAAVIAALIVDKAAVAVTDDGSVSTIEANLVTAIQAVAQALDYPISQVTGLQAALNAKLDATANAVSASKLANTFNLALTGTVTGAINIDGSQNVSLSTSIADAALSESMVNGLPAALSTITNTLASASDGTNQRVALVGINIASDAPFMTSAQNVAYDLIKSAPGSGYLHARNLTLDASGNLIAVDSAGNTRGYGTSAWVTTQISAETARAEAAESTLTTNLAAEVTRAKGVEATITNTIASADDGTNLRIALVGITKATGVPFMASAQGVTYSLIKSAPGTGFLSAQNVTLDSSGNLIIVDSAGNTRNYGTISWVNTQVAAEAARAKAVESTLTSNLATETARAEAAESTLTTNLAAEVTRAKGVEATITNTIASADDGTNLRIALVGITKATGVPFMASAQGVTYSLIKSAPGTGFLSAQNVTLDSSGNLIIVDSAGNTRNYGTSSYGTISGGYYIRIGNILIQAFSAGVLNAGDSIAFPVAFSAAPVVSTTVDNNRDGANRPVAINPTVGTVTASGFKINIAAISGANQPAGTGQVWVFAMGPA